MRCGAGELCGGARRLPVRNCPLSNGAAHMPHTIPRAVALIGAAAIAVLAIAAPASAHVSVSATNATQGGYSKVTFRVPTEDASASTIKLEVNIPVDAPVTSVSTKPVPGWS